MHCELGLVSLNKLAEKDETKELRTLLKTPPVHSESTGGGTGVLESQSAALCSKHVNKSMV